MGKVVASMINLKRIYEKPSRADGYRVLVERLWPRGLSKEKAAVDQWLKDVAPSPELRKWYSHDTAKWPEFCRRYRTELRGRSAEVEILANRSRKGTVTFLFAARDEQHNSAVTLRDFVESSEKSEGRSR
jgi:uncharacterized protein YeaO (DUF488 family)